MYVPFEFVDVTEFTVGANVSTVKLDDVTVAAALPAASLTSAVNVYDCPCVRP
jgi:hypothetical protein